MALLHDSEPSVRKAAVQAMLHQGAWGGEQIINGLRDPDSTVREVAAQLLWESPATEETLRNALKDDDAFVREAAAEVFRIRGLNGADRSTHMAAAGSSSKPEPPQGGTAQVEPPNGLNLDLGGGVTMKLALIPAGKFMMGEVEHQHEVTLSKPFYMGVTEVTQAQYEAIMGTNPSHFKGATNPVDRVSWDDATEFCKKLSEKTRRAVRLPTEAEWEYACRAGSKTRFCFGDAEEGFEDYGWYGANSGNTTHPVGQKKPNAWGLYDMHGNVWEWCSDWYGEYAAGQAADPTGPAKGEDRVLRGGCWGDGPQACRLARRNWSGPDGRYGNFGLRVVVVVGPGLQ